MVLVSARHAAASHPLIHPLRVFVCVCLSLLRLPLLPPPPRTPHRLFLSPYDLTPSYKEVHNKFSVRYFLNLVLVDEEDRRYFKQQEITLYRKDENAPQQQQQPPAQQQQQQSAQPPPAVPQQQQQQSVPAPVVQQQQQPEVQPEPAPVPVSAPTPAAAPVEQPPAQPPAQPQPHQSVEPLMFGDEPPLLPAEGTAASAGGS